MAQRENERERFNKTGKHCAWGPCLADRHLAVVSDVVSVSVPSAQPRQLAGSRTRQCKHADENADARTKTRASACRSRSGQSVCVRGMVVRGTCLASRGQNPWAPLRPLPLPPTSLRSFSLSLPLPHSVPPSLRPFLSLPPSPSPSLSPLPPSLPPPSLPPSLPPGGVRKRKRKRGSRKEGGRNGGEWGEGPGRGEGGEG